MLPPFPFFYRVKYDGEALVIDYSPLRNGLNFRLLGYTKVDGYTLTRWGIGREDEYMTGETLWKGTEPIATGPGVLPIYNVPAETNQHSALPQLGEFTFMKRYNINTGRFGLPASVAIALRDLKNFVSFTQPEMEQI